MRRNQSIILSFFGFDRAELEKRGKEQEERNPKISGFSLRRQFSPTLPLYFTFSSQCWLKIFLVLSSVLSELLVRRILLAKAQPLFRSTCASSSPFPDAETEWLVNWAFGKKLSACIENLQVGKLFCSFICKIRV